MPITVRAERADDPRRWVKISLSSRTPAEEERTISYSNSFRCSIQPLDAEAESYHLEVWESGILSGLTFVFRRSPMRGAMVHALEGQLGAEDMEGVAYAATAAGILATANGIPTPTNQNWVIREA
jgi:hypothetical protein